MGQKKVYSKTIKYNPKPLEDIKPLISSVRYPFDETKYLNEIKAWVDKCNSSGHYSSETKEIHTMELIMQGKDMRALLHSTMTALTYLDRFGSKGGYNRKDLLKAAHYILFALYAYDHYGPENKSNEDKVD